MGGRQAAGIPELFSRWREMSDVGFVGFWIYAFLPGTANRDALGKARTWGSSQQQNSWAGFRPLPGAPIRWPTPSNHAQIGRSQQLEQPQQQGRARPRWGACGTRNCAQGVRLTCAEKCRGATQDCLGEVSERLKRRAKPRSGPMGFFGCGGRIPGDRNTTAPGPRRTASVLRASAAWCGRVSRPRPERSGGAPSAGTRRAQPPARIPAARTGAAPG